MASDLRCPICGAEPFMMVSWNDDPHPNYVNGIIEPAYAGIQCPDCGLRVMSGRFGEDGQHDMAARDDARRDAVRRWRGLSYSAIEDGRDGEEE
jgi:DNA-directed RNA polymerase subunit RPC12/RpoP